jgi:hypothetical protein
MKRNSNLVIYLTAFYAQYICKTSIFIDGLIEHNQIYNDDSKFARQLKKLLRDEEEEKRFQKLVDLNNYLEQPENIKVNASSCH